MITLTLIKLVKKDKITTSIRTIAKYHSTDKARKDIADIMNEVNEAKRLKREPKIRIDGVSYDTKSERTMLLELKAISSIDNEGDFY